jgi:hypothetical protein
MNDPLNYRISRPDSPLDAQVLDSLRHDLEACSDVAFAYLPQVEVPEAAGCPNLVLFVWLTADALKSMRSALNMVSQIVAGALPKGEFVDVVILNSAPELLPAIEETGCLVVENDGGERQAALDRVAGAAQLPAALPLKKRWWWPF